MPASKSRRAAHIFDLEGPCLELLAVPYLPFALTCKTFYKATQNKRRPPAGIARRRWCTVSSDPSYSEIRVRVLNYPRAPKELEPLFTRIWEPQRSDAFTEWILAQPMLQTGMNPLQNLHCNPQWDWQEHLARLTSDSSLLTVRGFREHWEKPLFDRANCSQNRAVTNRTPKEQADFNNLVITKACFNRAHGHAILEWAVAKGLRKAPGQNLWAEAIKQGRHDWENTRLGTETGLVHFLCTNKEIHVDMDGACDFDPAVGFTPANSRGLCAQITANDVAHVFSVATLKWLRSHGAQWKKSEMELFKDVEDGVDPLALMESLDWRYDDDECAEMWKWFKAQPEEANL